MGQNGGKRAGAGRKPKAEEQRVRKLGIDAITRVYGSVEEYYEFIAKQSKNSFPHLKLIQEYVYGKPKETVETTNVNISKELTEAEVKLLDKQFKDKYGS